jgi:dolichol-phosphate mannosyltransferase
MPTMKNVVIIPTYNELENIERIVGAVFAQLPALDVLVVDDGSPDGTADRVRQLQTVFPGRLHLEERRGKLGLGTAYIHGFRWALAHGYDFVFEMDADFSHDPNDLPRLLSACQDPQVGLAVGSRYVPGGRLQNWPLTRILISRGASVYVRLVTCMPVKDPTAGFICYRREVLEKLDLDKIRFVGYAFQIEMKFAAWCLGYRIREVPITFKDRLLGVSKMSARIFNEAFMGVLKMKWRSFFESYAKR